MWSNIIRMHSLYRTQSIMWNNKQSTFNPYPFCWDSLHSLGAVWRNLRWDLVDPGWNTWAKLERAKTCTHIREAMLFCCASVCASGSMNEEASSFGMLFVSRTKLQAPWRRPTLRWARLNTQRKGEREALALKVMKNKPTWQAQYLIDFCSLL